MTSDTIFQGKVAFTPFLSINSTTKALQKKEKRKKEENTPTINYATLFACLVKKK